MSGPRQVWVGGEIGRRVWELDMSYYRYILSGKKDALERVLVRARIDANENFPYSYTARDGRSRYHTPELSRLLRRLA